MIRLFNIYYPIRTAVLLIGDALIVWTSFMVAAWVTLRQDLYIELFYDHGFYKIFIFTGVVLLCSHWLDLYDTARLNTKGELYFRLLMVPGLLAFVMAGINYVRPDYLLGGGSNSLGLVILTVALFGWRLVYGWLVRLPFLVERVYVVGTGERAQRLVRGLCQNPETGVEIASWTGKLEGPVTRESVGAHLIKACQKQKVHRVILAVAERRDVLPVRELLELRLNGVKIEEATSWLERVSGKIDVENLYPSWVILGEGFRRSTVFIVVRRVLSVLISLVGLLLTLPFVPLIMFVILLDSEGPVFCTQTRVGKGGRLFKVVKFRTTHLDAEAVNGPQLASNNNSCVTRVGRFLCFWRLDDIPQLWCVLKGDMAIVGPRPERPELVELLSKEIPYYGVRHMVRPGLTGWAQIKYKYGSKIEDEREKLQYDLYYIKNASIGLDLLIMFQTIKTVLLRRGTQ